MRYKAGISIVLVSLTLASGSGCVTRNTIDAAQNPQYGANANGDWVETKSGNPGYYALVPLAVVADIVLIPGYIFYSIIYVSNGCKN
jgi:uncharacterized protein YceK